MTKTTANEHQDGTIMDLNLFKIIGLRRLLHKSSIKIGWWGIDDWYRTLLMVVMWLTCGLEVLQFTRLYLTMNDLHQFLSVGMAIAVGFICAFKGYVLLKYADRLFVLLDITRYSFTFCSRRDPSYLRQYRDVLYPCLRLFVIYWFIGFVLWVTSPLFLNNYVTFLNLDGTIGHYRPCPINIWCPLSETVYNWLPVWILIYMIEIILCGTIGLFSWIFSCFLVTMCVALDAHFRTITAAYETLGGGDLQTHNQGICTESEYYDELILHIKCNQKIIKIYDEFLHIIEPVVIIQIIIIMYTTITLIYSCLMLYLTGSTILTMSFFKLSMSYGLYLIELYIHCYIFDHLETSKSKINNGLWNSNWAERDLKFRKAVLMAMIMNSSHNQKIKLSPTSVVNLELFAKAMNISYTVVSVLINTRDKYV